MLSNEYSIKIAKWLSVSSPSAVPLPAPAGTSRDHARRRARGAPAVRATVAGTSMQAIAAEAGVAPKTVYLAFATKSGLLRALWDPR